MSSIRFYEWSGKSETLKEHAFSDKKHGVGVNVGEGGRPFK